VLPERPRIQFLRSLTSEDDVRRPPSAFARFVLGEDPHREVQIVSRPYGMAFTEGQLYVCDSGGGRGAIFDLAKGEFRTFGDRGPYRLGLPANVCIGPQGEKYVTDTVRGQILILNRADKPVRSITKPAGLKPCDAVWHDRELYVADLKTNRILVMDPQSGRVLRQLGKTGSQPGEFCQPTHAAVDRDGTLYVADSLNFRIQIFDAQSNLLSAFGRAGDGTGDFSKAKGVAVDSEGHVYVVDSLYDVVQVFDRTGRFLLSFGGSGRDEGLLWLPTGIFIDGQDRIYVGDSGNSRVQVYQYLRQGS